MAAEVALAFILLAGAGLLLRTLWTMQDYDRGFQTDRVISMTLSLPATSVPTGADVRSFHARLLQVQTLDGALGETIAPERFRATLLAVFAAVALLLAAIGIYGVTAHAVAQRTREIGVRMTLGAGGRDVVGLVIAQHVRPALVGLAVGVAGAVALGQYLRSLVFGVGVTDPATFALMAFALLAVAVAACTVPALRATRVDPLVALRTE